MDLIIRSARLHDGRTMDIGISDGVIVAMARGWRSPLGPKWTPQAA